LWTVLNIQKRITKTSQNLVLFKMYFWLNFLVYGIFTAF
jgi:hypothetical protein